MCAIIGWIGENMMTPSFLKKFLMNAESSGPMSTGLISSSGPDIEVWKRAVSASYAVRNHNHRIDKMAKSTMGIGHTRYATHGAVIDQNAHPFTYENVHFVHNGVIPNYREILHCVVDSECLGPLIKERNIARARGSVGLAWMELINGVWKMFVYKHSQTLTACKVTTPTGEFVAIASRPHHVPRWPAESIRQPLEFQEGIAYEVTTEGLFEAWRNPIKEMGFTRVTVVNGQYIGG